MYIITIHYLFNNNYPKKQTLRMKETQLIQNITYTSTLLYYKINTLHNTGCIWKA